MKEEFLHFIWQNGYFEHERLKTTQSEKIQVVNRGMSNANAGPDFLNAQILINDILWVGHIEIHKQATDWYAHGHEKDPAYDNVVLHIVCDDNMPVYNSNNVQIPTLELTKFFDKNILRNYNRLIKNKAILRCQNDLKHVDKFVIVNFKYRLFIERLENKYDIIKNLLKKTQNNWNQIFYETLLKYIGGSVNKDAFELLANFLPYSVFIKYKESLLKLEALLFGVAGLLEDKKEDDYYQLLQTEFNFLKAKHNLKTLPSKTVRFHRLRPSGFPTIRLAQFARLYYQTDNLYEKLLGIDSKEEAYELLDATASSYWDKHYNFDKLTKPKKKKTGKGFIDVILINVIVPLKFAYQKHLGQNDTEQIINLMETIKPEKNKIVDIFNKINLPAQNALDSQAILQLNKEYCLKNKCLSCDIGNYILKKV